jgi:hypothetical protein
MYRVDHAFITPSVQRASLALDGYQGTFTVMCEEEDVREVAKICFVSWIIGPGRKIVLKRKLLD